MRGRAEECFFLGLCVAGHAVEDKFAVGQCAM